MEFRVDRTIDVAADRVWSALLEVGSGTCRGLAVSVLA